MTEKVEDEIHWSVFCTEGSRRDVLETHGNDRVYTIGAMEREKVPASLRNNTCHWFESRPVRAFIDAYKEELEQQVPDADPKR